MYSVTCNFGNNDDHESKNTDILQLLLGTFCDVTDLHLALLKTTLGSMSNDMHYSVHANGNRLRWFHVLIHFADCHLIFSVLLFSKNVRVSWVRFHATRAG